MADRHDPVEAARPQRARFGRMAVMTEKPVTFPIDLDFSSATHLPGEGELVSVQWPAVPRVGESVASMGKTWKVIEVTWQIADGIPCVYLGDA